MKTKLCSLLKMFLVSAMLLMLVAGCGSDSATSPTANKGTGGLAAKITWDGSDGLSKSTNKAGAPVGVVTVRIVVTGSGLSGIQKDFPAADGGGVIDGVLAGTGRTVKVQGLNASGYVIYQGEASNVAVNAGEVTSVWIVAVSVKPFLPNAKPTANAGTSKSVSTGTEVTLNGNGSNDLDGDPLTYTWSFTSRPDGSSATLSSATETNPTFTADVAGDYTIALVVNDGKVDSDPSTVTITAIDATVVGGIISTDTTWTKANSPYKISSPSGVQVAYGATLTIEPGVIVEGSSIQVFGTLRAIGLPADKIQFNNVFILGNNSHWTETYFMNLEYVVINEGSLSSNGSYGKLYLRDSVVKDMSQTMHLYYPVEDCYIERNIFIRSGSIYVGNSGPVKVYITNNVFYQNQFAAIMNWAAYDTSETIVRLNSFLNTAGIAVGLANNHDTAGMSATNNYWGTTDISTIENMIYDKNDYLGCASYINYLPILTAADPNTPDPTPYLD